MTDSQHPTPELIAAYLAREVSTEERRQVQHHLLSCPDCRKDVSEAVMLTSDRRSRRWIAVAVPLAAAAGVLFLLLPGQSPSSVQTTLRGGPSEGVRQFAAVRPADGGHVARDSVEFVWRAEGPSAHYILTVTDQRGDVIWTARTRDTTLSPPASVGLAPDDRYYWYIDALLEGAQTSTTGVREFTIRP